MHVLIKMIDGTNIVTEAHTATELKAKVVEGQSNPSNSVIDILDIGGANLSINTLRVCYIKEIPNT